MGKKKLSLKAASAVGSSANHAIGEYARNIFQLSIILIKKLPRMQMD